MRRFSDLDCIRQPMQVAPDDPLAPDGPPLHVAHICIWGFLAEMFLAASCVLLFASVAVRTLMSAI